ncbi:hypothetical protein [Mycobacteroides abscessus]|uniref:hypothetical protein n=1 Tax=Mycobacteroides abscessus TaxID=36809 RepID=UPI0009CA2717|nr:hypothetical protein [Mycobacteroides abscessus]SKG19173.1 Uncharacterised protein [Mycobacteroides abscessus subsp. massiliense]SKH00168.1 Uncharacterised protein [Mycobacteroides abscessus subsp. massiliense]SKI01236.1 Uncharacterised protein [Mycobacteroides abscessus subsp. massiliense]SKJ05725.1 Uncharacterised protein [Mycobacteroides abscessus subsp. massiliense]SKJ08524.1 Uncharacterised protein [Mycobacteroides abscessus subsp. massiliense]
MTTYQEILEAAGILDYDESLRRIKDIAVKTLSEADRSARILKTDHFNHSYLPDFVMRWPNREDRLVYLRASSYAEEIEEDVVRLADRHPVFLQLSEFRPYAEVPVREAIESLDQSAGAAKSLVTSIPAIGYLDDSPRTGQMLSSFVMRGGRGVVEDDEAQIISQRVESGFEGAISSDREKTADAIQAVESLLDPSSTQEFTHLFEAAWISGGASAADFPGGVTSIGDELSADLLTRLLEIVPDTMTDFWEQVGRAITIKSFSQLHLVGEQPQLKSIMRSAVHRLISQRCTLRLTQRADQMEDPFLWQVDNGFLSLRGAGGQVWVGATVPPAANLNDDTYSVEASPTLSGLSTRAERAGLTISDIAVRDAADIGVRFKSPGDRDVATSDLVERVTESLGTLVRVDDVVARVNGKSVNVQFETGTAVARTSSKVAVSNLIWNSWNLLFETTMNTREGLEQILSLAEDSESSDDGSDLGESDEVLNTEET